MLRHPDHVGRCEPGPRIQHQQRKRRRRMATQRAQVGNARAPKSRSRRRATAGQTSRPPRRTARLAPPVPTAPAASRRPSARWASSCNRGRARRRRRASAHPCRRQPVVMIHARSPASGRWFLAVCIHVADRSLSSLVPALSIPLCAATSPPSQRPRPGTPTGTADCMPPALAKAGGLVQRSLAPAPRGFGADASAENRAPMAVRLDPLDWRILKELQADGSMTNVALASRVGLSAPPCLRRVRALEEAGLIAGYTVLLDEAALGFEPHGVRHGRAAQPGRGGAARLREPRARAGRSCARPTCCRARATTC